MDPRIDALTQLVKRGHAAVAEAYALLTPWEGHEPAHVADPWASDEAWKARLAYEAFVEACQVADAQVALTQRIEADVAATQAALDAADKDKKDLSELQRWCKFAEKLVDIDANMIELERGRIQQDRVYIRQLLKDTQVPDAPRMVDLERARTVYPYVTKWRATIRETTGHLGSLYVRHQESAETVRAYKMRIAQLQALASRGQRARRPLPTGWHVATTADAQRGGTPRG
jgi:multidrug efflux pump subunit AcrA (membrane-fusion protein)